MDCRYRPSPLSRVSAGHAGPTTHVIKSLPPIGLSRIVCRSLIGTSIANLPANTLPLECAGGGQSSADDLPCGNKCPAQIVRCTPDRERSSVAGARRAQRIAEAALQSAINISPRPDSMRQKRPTAVGVRNVNTPSSRHSPAHCGARKQLRRCQHGARCPAPKTRTAD